MVITRSNILHVFVLIPKLGEILDERRSAPLQFFLQDVAFVEEDDKLDVGEEPALTYPFPQRDAVFDTVHGGIFDEGLVIAGYRR